MATVEHFPGTMSTQRLTPETRIAELPATDARKLPALADHDAYSLRPMTRTPERLAALDELRRSIADDGLA